MSIIYLERMNLLLPEVRGNVTSHLLGIIDLGCEFNHKCRHHSCHRLDFLHIA